MSMLPHLPTAVKESAPLLCVIDEDQAELAWLSGVLREAGYEVRAHASLAALRAAWGRVDERVPMALILRLADGDREASALRELATLGVGGAAGIGLVVLSAREDLDLRLAVQRNGAHCFLPSPVDPQQLRSQLQRLTQRQAAPAYRVLLVDDDDLLLAYLASLLQGAGMQARSLDQPRRLLEVVDEFQPDVVVLDVHLQEFNGVELAAVLHQRMAQQGRDLPVVFLSADTDRALHLKALAVGGDDFLIKPVDGSHLVEAVTARARRSRMNNNLQYYLRRALYERDREHEVLDKHAIFSAADVTGTITAVNEQFCAVTGYSREELLGQNHRIVKSGMHPPAFYEELWATIASGRIWQGEICNRRKDGNLYWVQSTIVPFVDADGVPYQYVSIRTDISRIKRGQAVLRSLLETTVTAAGDRFYDKLVEGLASALGVRVAFIARRVPAEVPSCETVAMWDGGRLVENFRYPLPGTPCEALLERGAAVYPQGVAQQFPEDRWLTEQGFESYIGVPLLDSDGKLLGHMGVMDAQPKQNAAEVLDYLRLFAERVAAEMVRERSERELRAHRERLRRGQVYANIGTWDWNITTGELYWTERIAPLFGYPEGELETSYENFLQAVHPDDRQAVIDAVNACVERDVPYQIEHRVVWPDGTVRWLLERGAVIRDAQGKPLQMLGVVQDIDDRKRAEQALRESTALLSEAQALAHLGSWRLDLATNEVVWSDQLYRMFGFDPRLPPPPYTEHQQLFTAESWERLSSALVRTVNEGIPYELELETRRQDGSQGWMWVRGEQLRDERGQVIALRGVAQDITERKRAEMKLAQRERELLQAQSLARIGNWVADLVTGELYWSDEIYRIFGHAPGSFSPSVQAFHEAVHPEDRELVRASEQKAQQTGRHDVVHRIVRPDGTVRHVHELAQAELDESGRVVRLSGTVQDVTERVEAEQRFAFAVEGAGDGIWDWNMTTGEMALSGHYESMLGYAKGELTPTIEAWKQSVHPDDLERVQAELNDYLAGRRSQYAPELRLRCKDGSYKWVLCRGTVVQRSATGQPLRMIGIHSDISARKRAEQALVEAREAAERANQAKSEFLSSMSHELRTPMNAILGFAQLLEYDATLSEEQRDNTREILKAGKHLLALINEVLDLARVESGRLELSIETVELECVVQECLTLVGSQAQQRQVALHSQCPAGVAVRADRTRLKQVLLNLLSNAVKYNRPGGQVRLGVVQAQPGRLRIEVEDNGVGIPASRLEELFQPFSRLGAENSGVEGTGIGLTITRRLVELMNGSVGVRSEEGVGSLFWIELPQGTPGLSSGGTEVPVAAAALAPPSGGPSQTVVYIEDNPANTRLVAQILGRLPQVQLLAAATPQAGIELIMARKPQLILLDINLPQMNGYQVLDVLRGGLGLHDVPVVAISANAMPRDIERGRAAGFADYLVKPLDVAAFLATVERLLKTGREGAA